MWFAVVPMIAVRSYRRGVGIVGGGRTPMWIMSCVRVMGCRRRMCRGRMPMCTVGRSPMPRRRYRCRVDRDRRMSVIVVGAVLLVFPCSLAEES